MAVKPFFRRRTLLVLLAIAAIATATEGFLLARAERWNQLIGSEEVLPDGGEMPAEVRFARALALGKKGERQAALSAYREIDQASTLWAAARYNSGNLLLAEALALDEKTAQGQRIPLIELAKESYREVLRADPGHWDARFNYERAQRLLPDPDFADEEGGAAPIGAERAVTTMRGYSPGLP